MKAKSLAPRSAEVADGIFCGPSRTALVTTAHDRNTKNTRGPTFVIGDGNEIVQDQRCAAPGLPTAVLSLDCRQPCNDYTSHPSRMSLLLPDYMAILFTERLAWVASSVRSARTRSPNVRTDQPQLPHSYQPYLPRAWAYQPCRRAESTRAVFATSPPASSAQSTLSTAPRSASW